MKTLKLTVALSACLLLAASSAQALDGDIGETSDTTSDVTVEIAKLIKLSNVDDTIDLGRYDGTNAPLLQVEDVCVATNIETTPLYRVKATGSGAAGAFTLASGSNTIAYTVRWNDEAAGAGTWLDLVAGVQKGTDVENAHSTLATATDNASFEVKLSQDVLDAAYSGTYTGTLSIEVDPQ